MKITMYDDDACTKLSRKARIMLDNDQKLLYTLKSIFRLRAHATKEDIKKEFDLWYNAV